MREIAIQLVAERAQAQDGRNVLREYLQSRILGAMQQADAMMPLAFMGGTALRFLYRLQRYSEDLDFTLERREDGFSFNDLAESVERTLKREGYSTRVRINDSAVVAKAQIGFSGLLAETGVSANADQVLWVRLGVDTNPPAGAHLAVSTIDRYGLLRLQHHDLSSLFAGKIAAVLARDYTKGRDLYDLLWYLTRDEPLTPNIALLGNALAQTAPSAAAPAVDDWRRELGLRLTRVDWEDARADVAPFLEQSRDIDALLLTTFQELGIAD